MSDMIEQPAQFRKKPVVITALQWTGENLAEVLAFTGKHPKWNEWFEDYKAYEKYVKANGNIFKILTLDGSMKASPGDWIIRGVKGEHYPCNPDIFAATYEPAALPAQPAHGELVANYTGMGHGPYPKADPNCQCICHRQPGVMHVAACCHPPTPPDSAEELDALVAEAVESWSPVLALIREYDEAFPYAEKDGDDEKVTRMNRAITALRAKGGCDDG